MTTEYPSPAPAACCPSIPDGEADAALENDAAALQEAVSGLLRVFQLRDRDTICCHDVSVTQCYALEALVRGRGLTLNQLAEELLLDKSTTSRVVGTLVQKGYAERATHPEDGRAILLGATAEGTRLHRRIQTDLVAEVKQVVAGIAPPVRRAMTELLGRLAQAAGTRVQKGGGCCKWSP